MCDSLAQCLVPGIPGAMCGINKGEIWSDQQKCFRNSK
jgi:hypothetical protein